MLMSGTALVNDPDDSGTDISRSYRGALPMQRAADFTNAHLPISRRPARGAG